MALTDNFIHRCTIQRATSTLDAYNNAKPEWTDVATNRPCRLVVKEQQRFTNERAEDAISTKYMLLLGASEDVLERDQIIVEGQTFTLEKLLPRNSRALHHLSARLSVVT